MTNAQVDGRAARGASARPLHILVVDDNNDCAESMALLLGMYGHTVEIARNGLIALEMAHTSGPDVVILDIGMPGMNGHEVARRLSSPRPQKTPLLIALTGFGGHVEEKKSKEAGFDLHLVKPVNPDELKAVLDRFQQLLRSLDTQAIKMNGMLVTR